MMQYSSEKRNTEELSKKMIIIKKIETLINYIIKYICL